MILNLYFFTLYAMYTLFSLYDFLNQKSRNRSFLILFSLVFLSYMVGFRGEFVGRDYQEYVRIFKEAGTIASFVVGTNDHSNIHGEPFFIFITMVLNSLNTKYYFIFFIFGLISLTFNHLAIKKYSPFIFLSILIYLSHAFLYKELIQIRAGIAASILLFGIQYLSQQNFKKYSMVVIAASLFHSGAIIGLLLYYFNKFDFSKKTLYLLIFFSIILYIVGAINIFIDFTRVLNLLPQRAELYLNYKDYIKPLGILHLTTLKQIVLGLFLIYKKDYFYEKVPYFKAMLYMYIFSTILLISLADFDIFAARLASYFSFVEVLLIPLLILLTKDRVKQFIIFCSILIYALLLAYVNLVHLNVVREYTFVF